MNYDELLEASDYYRLVEEMQRPLSIEGVVIAACDCGTCYTMNGEYWDGATMHTPSLCYEMPGKGNP